MNKEVDLGRSSAEPLDNAQHLGVQQRWTVLATIIVACCLLALIGYLGFTAGAIIERGDGVNHYSISRWSWSHPHLLLDHWGKPLFTLLASPFAQFGMNGVLVFGLVISFVAVLFGIRVLRSIGPLAPLAFVVLLLTAPLYVLMVMAGMTEPLFGVLTVVVVALFHIGKDRTAAVVASFLPFARPEAVVFLPFVALWLVIDKRWKLIPILTAGSVVYALIGWHVLGDPLWYFHNDPYANGPSIYGSGDPWIFLRRLDSITGRPLMVLFGLGLIVWPVLRRIDRTERRAADRMLVLCALPVAGILAIHMVLWGLGIKGSAGILRVASTAVPVAALFASYVPLRLLTTWRPGIHPSGPMTGLLTAGLLIWSLVDLHGRRMFPIPPDPDEHALRDAGELIKHELDKGAKLFTTHPFLAICADVDPFDSEQYEMSYGYPIASRMESGDILFWDNELGPNESGIPFDSLWNDQRLELIGFFEPTKGHKVIRGVYYELFVFRCAPAQRIAKTDTLVMNTHADETIELDLEPLRTNDDPGTKEAQRNTVVGLRGLPRIPAEALLDEYHFQMRVSIPRRSNKVPLWVYEQWKDDELVRRRQEELEAGVETITLRLPPDNGDVSHVFRLDDPGDTGCRISNLIVVRHRWTQLTGSNMN